MIETKMKEPTTEFVMSVEVCLDGETWNRVYVHKKYREIVKWDGELDHARRYKKFDDTFSSFRKMAKPECWYRNFQIHEVKTFSEVQRTRFIQGVGMIYALVTGDTIK